MICIFSFSSTKKKREERDEKEKPAKKKSIFSSNKVLLLKCKKVGGSKAKTLQSDKCTNTCRDKGTNTVAREEEEEEVSVVNIGFKWNLIQISHNKKKIEIKNVFRDYGTLEGFWNVDHFEALLIYVHHWGCLVLY